MTTQSRAPRKRIKLPRPECELEARIREIRAENAKAERPCPGCGCTPRQPCTQVLGDGEWAVCGRVPGHEECSACVTLATRGIAS